jgi:hypothetical protein
MRTRGWVVGFVLAGLVGCGAPPPLFRPASYEPLPNVETGATAAEVRQTLGRPDAWRNGWWSDGAYFDEETQVWFYKGKGRVIFSTFHGRVLETQADPTQPRHPVSAISHGLLEGR